MKSCLCLVACSLLLLFACSCERVRTVNRDASPEARNLLDFLYEIQGRYILSGQHNFIAAGTKYTDLIKEDTGKSPLLWGSDFSFCYEGSEPIRFQQYGPINLSDPGTMAEFESLQSLDVEFTGLTPRQARRRMVETAIAEYRKGHIVTLMWHACPPGSGDYCDGDKIWVGRNRMPDREWQEMLTEDTPLNSAWKAQMDTIAFYLKQLMDAGVPVLWRPYHEMNGDWFWWGGRKGKNGFKKLWIMMYDYLVRHHGLNNLIWVWNPSAPRDVEGDRAYAYKDFWPGSEYVDVLAADLYRDDWSPSHYRDLVDLADGKPVAIGLAMPPPELRVLQTQDKWTWFMSWGNRIFWGSGIDRLRALFSSGRALALEDVVREDGRYRVRQ